MTVKQQNSQSQNIQIKEFNVLMKYEYQQGFRVIPSTQPLKSPSPDRKNQNLIIATCSPKYIQMNRQIEHNMYSSYTPKPSKSYEKYWQKQKLQTSSHHKQYKQEISNQTPRNMQFMGFTKRSSNQRKHLQKQYSTQAKGQYLLPDERRNISYRTQIHQKEKIEKSLSEKDEIIGELKKIINMMTENGKHLKHSQSSRILQDNDYLKHQLDVLTLQNEKLLGIIDKMRMAAQKNQQRLDKKGKQTVKRTNQNDSNFDKNFQNQKRQVKQLQKLLQQKQESHQKQIDQLIKSHKSLAIECKAYQSQKEAYLKQNQKLINLIKLKDKERGNYKNLINASQNLAQQKQYNQRQDNLLKSKQKLSLTRIKEQHNQNLKHLKNSLYHEVQIVFQKMTSTIEDLNLKIYDLEDRISKFQHLKQSVVLQDHIKKSQIYIQEAPSSSQRYSRQNNGLSRILQQSRKSNEKLQIELYEAKKQVQNYKEKIKQLLSSNSRQDENPPTFGENRYWNQGQFEQLKDKIKYLQKELGTTIRQKQAREKQLIDLQMRIFKAEQQRLTRQNTSKLQSSYKQKEAQKNRIQTQRQLKSQLILLNEQIQSHKQRVSQLQSLFQNKQAEYQELEKANSKRQSTLLNQINNFQKYLEQTEQNYKAQKLGYKKQMQILVRKLQQKSEQARQLEVKCIQSERFEMTNKGIMTKRQQELKDLINKRQQELALKQKDLCRKQQQIQLVISEVQEKKKLVQSYLTELQAIKKQNGTLRQSREQIEQKYKTTVSLIDSSQHSKEAFTARLSQLESDVQMLRNQKEKACRNNQMLLEEIQNKNKAIQSIIFKIQHNHQENKLKTNQIIQAIILQIQEIQDINDQLTSKNSTIQNSLESALCEKQAILKQNNQISKQIFSYSQQKQILIEKIKYLEASIRIYEKQLAERKEFCDQLISKHAIIQKQLSITSRSRILQNQHKKKLSSTIKQKMKTIIDQQDQEGQKLLTMVSQIKSSKIKSSLPLTEQ